jgi:opacity protein-like surface antigen
MRVADRISGKVGGFIFILSFALAVPMMAQNLATTPAPAAAGPSSDLAVGYTYLRMPVPGSSSVNLNGLDVTGRMDFNQHWGLMADSNYARTPNVLGPPSGGYVLSFLGGPAFYPVEHRNTRAFLRFLAGAGMVDAAAPGAGSQYYHGWLIRFAYAGGAGVEQAVAGPFSLRVGGDYLRTSFYDHTGAVQPQNDFRVTASLVFRLKNSSRRVVGR